MNYRVEELDVSIIDASNRVREDYGDLRMLANSIKEKGLMHNLVVYQLPNEPTARLIAGGRRFKAMTEHLGMTKIPCRIYDRPLGELELKSLELEENLQRENLSYIEEITIKKQIHELQVALKGEKTSRSPGATGHSMSDTANMIGVTPASLSYDLKIAKAMEEFPDIQWDKFKNKSEALKCINTIGSSLIKMQKAEDIESELGDSQCRAASLIKNYVVGDFFNRIIDCPDGYFDLIELDPPYSVDLPRIKKGYNDPGYNKGGYNEVHKDEYPEFMEEVFRLCYKKAATNSWLICWFGPDPWFSHIKVMAEKSGWKTTGLVAIWTKGVVEDGIAEANAGQTHMPTTRLANAYEMFYYMWKGEPKLSKAGRSNVFGFKPVPHIRKIHPTERPLELITEILVTFGKPGDNVLVPFAGSGNTLISATLNNMKPIGFDLTQGYKDGYVIRVKEIFS